MVQRLPVARAGARNGGRRVDDRARRRGRRRRTAGRGMKPRILVVAAVALAVAGPRYAGAASARPTASVTSTTQKDVAGPRCAASPADNWWHADIRRLP